MAIYHLSAQVLSRSAGASAVAAAAYRAGENIVDERTGERHDYQRRAGVDGAEIVAPDDAPEWARERAALWNAAEAAERRRNSQVAREVRVAIPAELGGEARKELVREYARQQFAQAGMVADIAYHDFGGENPHAHIQLTMRQIEGQQFASHKERSWNAPERLEAWREAWAEHANRALERSGRAARIDHRSLAAQRAEALQRGESERAEQLDREPGIHVGKAAWHQETDKGVQTERGGRALAIAERNAERAQLREHMRTLERLRQQIRRLRELGRRLTRSEGRLWAVARRLGLPERLQQQREQPRPRGLEIERGR